MTGESPPPAAAVAAVSPATNDTAEDAVVSSFECCVCLDLLYKPVVLACGHMSCFWCVHKSMHSFRTSHCAICRHPYNHFPSICLLLHDLLLKLAPGGYKRREKEVLEEEKLHNVFSPQYTEGVVATTVHYDKHSCTTSNTGKGDANLENSRSISSEEARLKEKGRVDGMCNQVSVDDVLCTMCKELLIKPAVLNCGHVYCTSCLPGMSDTSLKCHACHSPHPGDLPNVCLDLDHFLEEQFPKEYTARKEQAEHEKLQYMEMDSLAVAESSSGAKKRSGGCFSEDFANTHWGVGCDSCGVYPIIGQRYRCKDCKERIGFDLCEECYNTNSKLAGRFNQQHTPDHEFELDDSQKLFPMLATTEYQEYVEVYVPGDEAEDHFDII